MENLKYFSVANAFILHGSVVNLITRTYNTYRLHVVMELEFDPQDDPFYTLTPTNEMYEENTKEKTGLVRPEVGLRRIPLLKRLDPKSAGKIKNVRKRLKMPIKTEVENTILDDIDDTILDF